MKLEGWEGTRNYEGQRLFCYLIRRFSQLEKRWEKKQWWKGNKQDGLKRARRDFKIISKTACTTLRNRILSKEYQDKHTPHKTHLAVKLSRHTLLLMHLMVQQAMYSHLMGKTDKTEANPICGLFAEFQWNTPLTHVIMMKFIKMCNFKQRVLNTQNCYMLYKILTKISLPSNKVKIDIK